MNKLPDRAADRRSGSVDPEALRASTSRAWSRQGGKALAAYLKPREEGAATDDYRRARSADVVKTLRQGRGILAVRSAARARSADASSARPISTSGAARSGGWPGEDAEPVVEPDPRDKRFHDPEWSQNPFFDFLKQAYLLTSQLGRATWSSDADGLDPHTRQKAEFYVKQIANAISPSNFVLTNPEVAARDAVVSNGENLVRGMKMLAEDIEAGSGDLQDPPVRPDDFEVGDNSRSRRARSSSRTTSCQLIQYAPTTETVLKRAAADRAAVDQQVLHPRSQPGEILHPLVRRAGPSPCSSSPGSIPTSATAQKGFERLHARRPRSPRSTRSSRRPARRRSTRSAIASAARCSR